MKSRKPNKCSLLGVDTTITLKKCCFRLSFSLFPVASAVNGLSVCLTVLAIYLGGQPLAFCFRWVVEGFARAEIREKYHACGRRACCFPDCVPTDRIASLTLLQATVGRYINAYSRPASLV